MYKCIEKIAPPIFLSLFHPKPENKCNIPSKGKLTEPFYREKYTQVNFEYCGSHLSNEFALYNLSSLISSL